MIWRHSSAPGRCDLFMAASMPARHIRKKDAVQISDTVVPLLLAVIYVVLNALNFGRSPGGFFTLEQVNQVFQKRYLLLAGWVHFGALDLFVGYWETKDAQRSGIHHLLLLPCLLLTFFFGPAGLLAYFIVRRASGCKAEL